MASNMAESASVCESILSGRTLKISDLNEVIGLLKKHDCSKASYYELGLYLQLHDNTLKSIEQEYRGKVDRCFIECLGSWLRKADDVENPTIDTLIVALRGMGENAVADGINEEKQIHNLPKSEIMQDRPVATPTLKVDEDRPQQPMILGVHKMEHKIKSHSELNLVAFSLKQKYYDLVVAVRKSLIHHSIDIEGAKLLIKLFLQGETEDHSMLKICINSLQKVHDFDSLFYFLIDNHFIGYLNYNLLKRLSKHILQDVSLTNQFDNYEKEYAELLHKISCNNLIDLFQEWSDLSPNAPVGLPRISFRLDSPWLHSRFYTWVSTFGQFSWSYYAFLGQLRRNCVIVTYAILPFFLHDVMRDLKDPVILKKLEDKGVTVIELPQREEENFDTREEDPQIESTAKLEPLSRGFADILNEISSVMQTTSSERNIPIATLGKEFIKFIESDIHAKPEDVISISTDASKSRTAIDERDMSPVFKPGINVQRTEFQEHVEQLNKNNQEMFKEIFKSINSTSPDYKCDATLMAQEYDHTKNRFKDIGAFDHTRVVLQETPGVPHSHYINANYIKGYYDDKLYIATQYPSKETCDNFWRMVWEQKTVTIVMLTNVVDSFKYWPSDDEVCYGDIVVRADRNIELPNYVIRGFKVFNKRDRGKKERTILQFHYITWPNKNVPAQASHVLDFMRAINSANDSKECGPVVVHCSAGVGRTGTIIALDIALEQLKSENRVDIEGIVKVLRQQRTQMVQELCQFVFIYNAVLEDIVYGDMSTLIDEFSNHYIKSQEEATLITDEFNKIGAVKPPAQSYSGPSVVPFDYGEETMFTAHYLDGYWTPNLFIKSPCPTKDNTECFWRLIIHKKCSHIINLSPTDADTYSYISEFGTTGLKFGAITISVGRKKEFNAGFLTRDINIRNEEDSMLLRVKYIQYQDMFLKHCFPRVDKFMKFIQYCLVQVESCHHGNHPILMHDDGSNGPVGIFATLTYCLQRAKKERIINILQAANHHYLQSPGLIVNLQFYAYCYDCLMEYSNKLLKEEYFPSIHENIALIRGKLIHSPGPSHKIIKNRPVTRTTKLTPSNEEEGITLQTKESTRSKPHQTTSDDEEDITLPTRESTALSEPNKYTEDKRCDIL